MTMVRGVNSVFRWSTDTCCAGLSNFLPGMASMYTAMFSADFNPDADTFPCTSAACMGLANNRAPAKIAPTKIDIAAARLTVFINSPSRNLADHTGLGIFNLQVKIIESSKMGRCEIDHK